MDLKELAKTEIVQRDIDVKGQSVTVSIKQLTVRQSNELFALLEAKNTLKSRKRLLAWSIVDADGKPQFTEADVEEMNLALASELEKLVLDVNGMSDAGAAAAKNG